jgi:uncharacterized membrane protein
MNGYIPLAYFAFGLCAFGALAWLRLRAWWASADKLLGAGKALRRGWLEGIPTLVDKAFSKAPFASGALLMALLAIGALLAYSLPGISQGAVLSLGLGLGLGFLLLFLLKGWENGDEAFLWMLGAFSMFLVAGSELRFVADRTNTIFKFWINGWVLMGLAFGAGFSKWFDAAGPEPVAKPKRGKKARPAWLWPAAGAALAFALVLLGAAADVSTQGRGTRNAPSFFAIAGLALLPGLWAAFSPVRPRLAGKAAFFGLCALGLLYPLGAVSARLSEAAQKGNPRLDGMAFMRERAERGASPEIKDYDKYDAEIIDWLNQNADKTEVLLEAPGIEMYKGYSRYAIYTGLPTLLGWDYQVGQQLGSRAGGVLATRSADALRLYATSDISEAEAMLKRYKIRWIVVGAIERKQFMRGQAANFDKFGAFCKEVLRNKGAVLYRYDPPASEAPKP